jgi:hypothetical protein
MQHNGGTRDEIKSLTKNRGCIKNRVVGCPGCLQTSHMGGQTVSKSHYEIMLALDRMILLFFNVNIQTLRWPCIQVTATSLRGLMIRSHSTLQQVLRGP